MLANFILVCIFLTNFVHRTNGVSLLQQLEKILQDEDDYDRPESLPYGRFYPPHQSRHRQKKKTLDSYPNLLNIQTLNLYGKPHKREREDADFDKFLRTETDRICKQTGRCGCSRGRCGNRAEDETADEVDELVKQINKQLANDDTDKKGLSYDPNVNKLKVDKDDDDDDDRLNEKTKHSDDVDIVVLDQNEIDDLLRKQDFVDLTRNSVILDTDTGKLSSGPKNTDHLRELIADIMNSGQANEKNARNSNVSPAELFKYYVTLKNQVVNLITFYIKNKQHKIPIEENLNFKQLQSLENLKNKYQQGLLKENDVKSEVVKTIFGEDSGTKVLPHSKNSRHIYIPKNFYEDILNLREINLRSQKRILPLTLQQKSRIINKDKANIIPKHVWRRSQKHDDQNYGVPFNLEVQGLGQINPN
ncbi:uncharacterized protein LOC116775364 [Danaus plexippus]|uniref:uncharacterized protein LOC116775364 n=1 Tax=Danaus plexippus TaxID=13037 RepID=UPI002AAF1641|nr:uncharacterized protein LOC116775364 [Danaus plexippus]